MSVKGVTRLAKHPLVLVTVVVVPQIEHSSSKYVVHVVVYDAHALDAVLTHYTMYSEAVLVAVQSVLEPSVELEAVCDDSIVVSADCNVESDDIRPLDVDTLSRMEQSLVVPGENYPVAQYYLR